MSEDGNRIMVAVDGTENGLAAVRYGAAEAARSGAELCLVHVIEPRVPRFPTLTLAPARPDPVSAGRARAALAMAEWVARPVVGKDNVSTRMYFDTPVDALLREASKARLLVLGRQPRRFRSRAGRGSVLGSVTVRAPVPVVVVPSSTERGTSRETERASGAMTVPLR